MTRATPVEAMLDLDDGALLRRVEDAGINASAPRQQRWLDGWLVRTCPGAAKRARCIQAVAAGHLPIDDRLARCRAMYAAAALPLVVRITPFSEPAGLDAHLEAAGLGRVDDSRVMIAPLANRDVVTGAAHEERNLLPTGLAIEPVASDRYAAWIGRVRGSTTAEIGAHAERLIGSPVPYRAFVVKANDGAFLAGGQVAIEDDLAGLYDVLTEPAQRGCGIGRALCHHLLGDACSRGARVAYLQVDARNDPARHLYRQLGFVDAYSYHYRVPAQTAGI